MKNLNKLFTALVFLVATFIISCSDENDNELLTKDEAKALDSFSNEKQEPEPSETLALEGSNYSIRRGGNPVRAVIFKGKNYTGERQEIRLPSSGGTYIWTKFDARSYQLSPGCWIGIRWWRKGKGYRHSYSNKGSNRMVVHKDIGARQGKALFLSCKSPRKRYLNAVIDAGKSKLYVMADHINLSAKYSHFGRFFNDKELKVHPINNWDTHKYMFFHKGGNANSDVVHTLPIGRYASKTNYNHRKVAKWKGASYISVKGINVNHAERQINTHYNFKSAKDRQRMYNNIRNANCKKHLRADFWALNRKTAKCNIGCIAINALVGESFLAPCILACTGGAATKGMHRLMSNFRACKRGGIRQY